MYNLIYQQHYSENTASSLDRHFFMIPDEKGYV